MNYHTVLITVSLELDCGRRVEWGLFSWTHFDDNDDDDDDDDDELMMN